MAIQSYQDLDVWKKSMKLAAAVHQLLKQFSADERYELVDRKHRGAVSVPS